VWDEVVERRRAVREEEEDDEVDEGEDGWTRVGGFVGC
jgi:hypothetical protein